MTELLGNFLEGKLDVKYWDELNNNAIKQVEILKQHRLFFELALRASDE
jgi:hypothetical protein